MSFRTGEFPVTADGAVVGRVTITQDGLLTVFSCICEYKTLDILRLAAVCRGKYVPLGVMIPEAGLLRTKKSFTKNALLNAGYEDSELFHLIRPEDVYREPAAEETAPPEQSGQPAVYNDFPDPETYDFDYGNDNPEPAADTQDISAAPETADGWLPLPNPGILFEDECIQEACRDIKNALVKEDDGYLLLAVPVRAAEPFPLMPVFCFGTSGQAGGQDCIIFKIKNGYLML